MVQIVKHLALKVRKDGRELLFCYADLCMAIVSEEYVAFSFGVF